MFGIEGVECLSQVSLRARVQDRDGHVASVDVLQRLQIPAFTIGLSDLGWRWGRILSSIIAEFVKRLFAGIHAIQALT